jgi:ABC-type sugar transport system ATPase subunit
MSDDRNYILEMKSISKAFGGVRALDAVDFMVEEGEVHALVGENGAGKSTLIKILAGYYRKDSGDIRLRGKPVEIGRTSDSIGQGIAIVHQEVSLVPYFDVSQNIFLGREPRNKLGLVDRPTMRANAGKLLRDLGLPEELSSVPVQNLPIAQQQLVGIAKALSFEPRIIVLDEPTASLSQREKEDLFRIIQRLKDKRTTIIYVSHRLEEIFEISDTVTVLKDGKCVCTLPISELTPETLVSKMAGKELTEQIPRTHVPSGDDVLCVRNLSKPGVLNNVNISAKKGMVLGITGMVGAGKTELAHVLFGLDSRYSGDILLNGEKVKLNSPQSAIDHGIALVPEDRRTQALVISLTLRENMTLSVIDKYCRIGFIDALRERADVCGFVDNLSIKADGPEQIVNYLSGGNQQKVVLAKWLFSNADILIMDEPTKGIDVQTKAEIYRMTCDLADQGKTVIFISSEIPEILSVSDRILVMYRGAVAAEFAREEATHEKVLFYVMGGGPVNNAADGAC